MSLNNILIGAIAIAAVVLAILSWVQTDRIDTLASDTCGGQNEVREIIRDNTQTEIANLKNTDPSLFPNIPPDEFQRLLEERRVQLQAQVDAASPISCAS